MILLDANLLIYAYDSVATQHRIFAALRTLFRFVDAQGATVDHLTVHAFDRALSQEADQQ